MIYEIHTNNHLFRIYVTYFGKSKLYCVNRFPFMFFITQLLGFLFVCLMVFYASFNTISVISWRSVLLVEETGGLEKTTDLSQVTDKLYHIMFYTSLLSRFEITASVVIGTDCIGSCKSN